MRNHCCIQFIEHKNSMRNHCCIQFIEQKEVPLKFCRIIHQQHANYLYAAPEACRIYTATAPHFNNRALNTTACCIYSYSPAFQQLGVKRYQVIS